MPPTFPLRSPEDLSAQLVAARKARGLTQKALAEQLLVDQSRVSQLEADPSRISFELLLAWSRILDLRLVLSDIAEDKRKAPKPNTAPDEPEW